MGLFSLFLPAFRLEVGGLDKILIVIDSNGVGKLAAGDATTSFSQL
jgi:hypothetical protein